MTDLEMLQQIEEEHSAWWHFRRALRAEDQIVFDGLWRHAKRHAQAAATTDRHSAFDVVLIGMLLGLARQLERHQPGMVYFIYDALGGPGNLPLACSTTKQRAQEWISSQNNNAALRCVEVSVVG